MNEPFIPSSFEEYINNSHLAQVIPYPNQFQNINALLSPFDNNSNQTGNDATKFDDQYRTAAAVVYGAASWQHHLTQAHFGSAAPSSLNQTLGNKIQLPNSELKLR
jgi:hypothetical protein